MKKLGAILLTLTLLIGLFPQSVKAAQSTNFEEEFTQYLNEVSAERGFQVTKEDIQASLAAYDETLDNYDTVGEVRDYLGQVIKADLSNIDYIYQSYHLNQEKLQQLLKENGEELNDYIYLHDLGAAVYFYTDEWDYDLDPNFDQNLSAYLVKVSKERGFQVTKEDIEASLASYGFSLDEFQTVEELSDFLGDVIHADLSNLDYYYAMYELDTEDILQLLKDNGKDINDYIFVDDLGEIIMSSYGGAFPGIDEEMMEELLPMLLEELDLTQAELQNLEDHFASLEEYFSDPETLKQIEELSNRMMAFENIEDYTDLTEGQIAEILSIYEELLSMTKLELKYDLVKDGSETSLSLMDLINLKELKGANLKVSVYNTDHKFLADFILTGEIIKDSAKDVIQTVNEVKQNSSDIKTVKGGKLPKTASGYIPNALTGLIIAFAGLLMYGKFKKTEGVMIEK